ncbi:MAG TPA: EAL domain-containing protein [Eoetvoesiella sp.]
MQKPIQAEAIFRKFAESALVGVYVVQDGAFRFVNARLAEMLQYDGIEMVASLNIFDTVADDERFIVEKNIERILAGEVREIRHERRARRKDGTYIDVEVFAGRLDIDGKTVVGGIMLDISLRKNVESSAGVASLVYEHSSEAIVIYDESGAIITVNPAFTRITGYSLREVIGQPLNALSSGRHSRVFYRQMRNALNSSGQWQGDVWSRRKNGEEYAERLSIHTSYNADGSVRCRVGLLSDITQKKKSDEFVWHQVNYDQLTGLPNRQLFHDRLKIELAKSRRAKSRLALLFLDLDFFKDINDTLGHGMGDQMLKQVAKRLSACVRSSDTVARMGGDEFTIIIGEFDDMEIVGRICQAILQRLAKTYVLGRDEAHISASIGVTFYPDDARDIESLIKNADLAMYAAKDAGRNQYNYFTPYLQETANVRRQLSREIGSALADKQFELHYQPIVQLSTGAIVKAEALIRWKHLQQGVVSPADFIDFAEDTGMIVSIGEWVFKEAARQAAQWRRGGNPDFQVSINVSPVQFRSEGIRHDDWLEYLQGLGLPGQSVVVEITERLLMDVSPEVTEKLLAFRDAGIQVALDDFGTGYSSLSYLKKFHIDYIKIDRSFVQNLALASDDMALCEAIIVMAHKLGLQVIAEGVGTTQQLALLAAAGCDYAQGYLFSRPVSAQRFGKLLESRWAEA